MDNPSPSAQKIVVIDLDDTLINTRQLKKLRFKALEKCGYKKDHIDSTYENIDGGYSTKKHTTALALLQPEIICDHKVLDEQLTSDLVFGDVANFLSGLKNHRLILLSHGDPDFQMTKLSKLGLVDFFDIIWLTPNNKEIFLKAHFSPDQEFIFINDKQSENDAIQKDFPNAVCYLIDRHNTKNSNTFSSLQEIKKSAPFTAHS